MALPEEGNVLTHEPVEEEQEPSLTWKLDLRVGRVTGMVDELAAIEQAVFKMLQTTRYAFLIYSFDYGNELDTLIGLPPFFVQSEVARMLEEALMQDDRIQGIEGVTADIRGNNVLVRFAVVTDYGSLEMEQEVTAVV